MIRFPNVESLHWALTSGIVPPSVSLSPGSCTREPSGAIAISPANPLPSNVIDSLANFGIQASEASSNGEPIAHWLQAIPLVREPGPPKLTDQTPVLIEGTETVIADLAREMFRLGNDRLSFRLVPTPSGRTVFMQVLGPPYYSLLRAIDRSDVGAVCAYLERAPGFWVEYGWTHPLAEQIRPASGQWTSVRAPGHWRTFDLRPITDLYEVIAWPEPPLSNWSPKSIDAFDAPLQLTSGNTVELAELWWLAEIGDEQIDELVNVIDSATIGRLTFAVGETDRGRFALLRARPHAHGPPPLELPAAIAFRSFLRVPNLFVPCGAALAPPLSSEMVRRLLADDSDRVTWLVPLNDGAFQAQSLPEMAFRPLGDWAEHVLAMERASLEEWAAKSSCDFAVWTSREAAPATVDDRPATDEIPSRADSPPASPPAPAAPLPRRVRRPRSAPAPAMSELSIQKPSELQVRLRSLEERFLDSDDELESPRRQALWPELARLNAALGNPAEAAHCWMHALWVNPANATEIAGAWADSERPLAEGGISDFDMARLMPPQPTTTADLRPLAAAVVWGCQQRPLPPTLRAELPAIQSYLTKHDGLLPIRAVWLAWHSMAMAAGSDALALARVRDRSLERLMSGGLNPDRDLPAFLRYSGSRGGDRLRTVRDRIEVLRLAIHRWSGFAPGDSLQQTAAYIDLMFAFGNARLGETGSARALLGVATRQLDGSENSAHRFLLEAFRWRIEQVLAGKPHAGPLPQEQIEYLDQMRREVQAMKTTDPLVTMPPYVVERMRKESRVVDPHEELDPYRHTKVELDSTIRELAKLSDAHDPRVLRDGLRRILTATATHSQPEVRLRALAEAIPLAARLGAASCGELLDRVGPLLSACPSTNDPIVQNRRAFLIERALLFAVHFDRTDLVAGLVFELESAIAEPAAPAVWEARSRMIAESLRSLRKCGLRDETDRLLQLLSDAAHFDFDAPPVIPVDRAGMEQVRTLLHVASGWMSAQHVDRARPILDRARAIILAGRDVPHGDWLLFVSLIDAYVVASARAPLEESLQRIEDLFTSGKMPRLPNTFTTHPYYSRLHLNVVESVVLALANEEFAMGPAARRWLDDDEYLVRRRIHRDMRSALNEESGDRI